MSAPGGRLDLLLKPGHFRFRTGKSEASAGMSASLIIGRHPHILSCPRRRVRFGGGYNGCPRHGWCYRKVDVGAVSLKSGSRKINTVVFERNEEALCKSNWSAGATVSTIEELITSSIHTAFCKYPEGDGGPNLDYEWIPRWQAHVCN
jgi:hypothetical protein